MEARKLLRGIQLNRPGYAGNALASQQMTRAALVAILVTAALAHTAFSLMQPPPHPTGDELHYIEMARDDAARGAMSPLPGGLRFGHRPELLSRLLAPLVSRGLENSTLMRRVSAANTALLLAVISLVFLQAKVSAAGDRGALVAAAVVAFFPWLGFHVHSLWPEILHAFLFAVALLAALLHLRSGALLPLAISGVATGAALLAKGSLAPFVPFFALFFAVNEFLNTREQSRARRIRRVALVIAPVHLGAILLIVAPQLAANWEAGHGLRLSANRWWNLELGITLPVDARDPAVLDTQGRWIPEAEQTRRYARAAPRALGREAAARTRTLGYLESHGPARVALAQTSKLFDLLLAAPSLIPQRQSTFDQALGARARWGSPAPGWIAMWQEPGRWAWRLLLPLGLIGLLARARKSPQRLFLALFTVSFLLAALAVPVKIRFLLPVVPLLALGVGFLVAPPLAHTARRSPAAPATT